MTQKKRIYFVRHGETDANINGIHQPADEVLNERGVKQAEIVAERFTRIPVEIIVTSPMKRAMQTAEEISSRNNLPLVVSDFFQERNVPDEIIGKKHTDPEAIQVRREIELHDPDSDWHYSNEDNYYNLHARALGAVAFLEERQEENIAVVTHGTFLRLIIGVMWNPELTAEEYVRLRSFLAIKNTGITLCDKGFHPLDSDRWKLVTWDDHAHLG